MQVSGGVSSLGSWVGLQLSGGVLRLGSWVGVCSAVQW